MATQSKQPLVLAVDDEPALRALCAATLGPHYRVVTAENGEHGLRLFFQHKPDLVLLDVSMPGMTGVEVCRRIRDLSDVPVVMLTAHGADHDVARGLDAGANDYVLKPFRPVELLARIRAHLRTYAQAAKSAAEQPETVSFDDGRLVIDRARRVASVRGEEVALTATEYKLLELLARHPGQVLAPDQILEQVWGPSYAGETGYVKAFVRLLRNKIEADPRDAKYLRSRRGLGYYLDPRPERSAAGASGSGRSPERAA